MASEGAIWFWESGASSAAEADAAAADIIEFDESPVNSKGAIITEAEFEIIRSDLDSEVAFGNLSDYQDTGVKRILATIPGIIKQPEQSTHQIRQNIKTFGIRDQQSKSSPTAPFGKVGLRLDRWKEYNTLPNGNRGWNIVRIKNAVPMDVKAKIGFVIQMIFIANDTGLESTPYDWST